MKRTTVNEKGDRVGAILGSSGREVHLLGYGRYEGRARLGTEAVGALASILRLLDRRNPRIRLDNGTVVWGCECWWGSERAVHERIRRWARQGRVIIRADIEEVRARYPKSQEIN